MARKRPCHARGWNCPGPDAPGEEEQKLDAARVGRVGRGAVQGRPRAAAAGAIAVKAGFTTASVKPRQLCACSERARRASVLPRSGPSCASATSMSALGDQRMPALRGWACGASERTLTGSRPLWNTPGFRGWYPELLGLVAQAPAAKADVFCWRCGWGTYRLIRAAFGRWRLPPSLTSLN